MAFAHILYKTFSWRAIQLGCTVVQNILFARLLQSAAYAEVYSLVYIFSLISGFFTFGLDIGLNYFITRGQLSIPTARRIIAGVTMLALIAGTGLLFVFRGDFAYPGLSTGTMLLFAALQIGGILMTSLAGAIFTAVGQNHEPVKWSVLGNILLIILALADFRFFGGWQARQNLFLLYFAFLFGQGLLIFLLSGRLPNPEKQAGQATTTQLFHFCFFTFLINFLFFVGARIGIYLLPYHTKPAELGNYIQVYKLVEYLGFVTAFLYYPFVTLAAGDSGAGTKDKVLLLVRLSNTLVLLVSLGGIALGYFLFPAIFGPSFGGMYAIFLWFIPGIFAVCSSSFLTAWFYGAGRIRYNLISAIIQLAVGLLLYYLLTPDWGVRGAALAFSGGALTSMAYDCWGFRRFHPFRLRDLFFIGPADWRLVWNFSGQLFGRR